MLHNIYALFLTINLLPAQMIKLRIAPTSTATFVCQYPRLIYEAVCAKRGRNFLQTPDFRRIFCNFARHCITE